MATSGEYAALFSEELGFSKGQIHARGQELRDAGLIEATGRGVNARGLKTREIAMWLRAILLDPERGAVADKTKQAGRLPLQSSAGDFGNLTVAWAKNIGDAFEALIIDAYEGRLQTFLASGGSLRIDIVDHGALIEIEALTSGGVAQLSFTRPNTVPAAPSAFRVLRIDSRIFMRIAALMRSVRLHDPKTGELVRQMAPAD